MTIPYPREAVPGQRQDPAEGEIIKMWSQMCWIIRALDEISVDGTLDKGKVEWLMTHCPIYRVVYARLAARIAREGANTDPDYGNIRVAGEIGAKIRGFFAMKLMTWATQPLMFTDLTTLNNDCLSIINWITANIPDWGSQIRTYSISGTDPDGIPIRQEVTATITLPPALLTQVQALRAKWGAKPQFG
jgi:hypothetical protein